MSWDCLAARGVVDGDFVVSSSGCVSLIQSAYALFLLAGQSLLGIGILSSEQGTAAKTFLAPAPLKWIRDCSSSRGGLYPFLLWWWWCATVGRKTTKKYYILKFNGCKYTQGETMSGWCSVGLQILVPIQITNLIQNLSPSIRTFSKWNFTKLHKA